MKGDGDDYNHWSETEDVKPPPEEAGAVAACCGVEWAAPAAAAWKCPPTAMRAGFPGGASSERTQGCAMAGMCRGMTRGGARGLVWLLPMAALALVTLGVAIALVPQVLSWLVAGGLICAGAAVLLAAVRLRKPRAPEE